MIATFITIIHITACIILILIILLQSGKGSDIGAAFGGASQTVFGPRQAATFLGKITTWSAIIFMVTSLFLAHSSAKQTEPSILKEDVKKEETVQEETKEEATPVKEKQEPVKNYK